MKRVHLIGIGGSGLSAIAKVLLESGYEVSGSDRVLSDLAQEIEQSGARLYIGHKPEQIQGADLVIRSSAVPDDNVEVLAALASGIPVLKRAEFLEELTASKRVIAIAGTHGKTTCTAMVAWMLSALGLDPSFIIGGKSLNLGTNAHAGEGAYFVIEADEYDRMFWGLRPQIALVTNVEHDHPDFYATPQEFFQAFLGFVERILPGGTLITCDSDPGAALLRMRANEMNIRNISYGVTGSHYNCYALNEAINTSGGYAFTGVCSSKNGNQSARTAEFNLRIPGRYNVRNALAALAVAHTLNLPLQDAADALNQFEGTGRRFELIGEAGGISLIDDYAHHPTEIKATLNAARERYPNRPIWVVWQPHTYSRTRTFYEDFLTAFEDADHVLVMEVYAAREAAPEDGFSSRKLVESINHQDCVYVPDMKTARKTLLRRLGSKDVLLVLSAGDADQLTRDLLVEFKARSADMQGSMSTTNNTNNTSSIP